MRRRRNGTTITTEWEVGVGVRTTVRHAGSGTTVTVDSDGARTAAASAHGDGTAGGSSASATAFPVSVEELTKEWLSLVVGAPIEGMDVASCDAAGFVSETYTATLRYQEIGNTSEEVAANAALLNYPTSVVVKMSGELEFKRFLAEGLGAYAKEKFAYASLPRELLSVRVPTVYGCFSDPDVKLLTMVMEDLAATAELVGGSLSTLITDPTAAPLP